MKNILTTIFLFFNTILLAGTFNAEVLNEEASFVVKHDVLYESYFIAIRINNSRGDDFSKVSIYYSEENPIYDFEAWIEDAKGNKIRDIEKKEITDRSDIDRINLFDDNCSRSFQLVYNVYPYVIKYKYSCKKKDFNTICWWTPVYDKKIPTLNATLLVDVPRGYQIGQYERLVNKPVIDSTGKSLVYTWKEKYDKLLKHETFSPSVDELEAEVRIIPIQFKHGIEGNQKDWASYGNWIFNLNKGLDELPESEVQKVKNMTSGMSDKKQVIKFLYRYMQDNIRYVSVQIGIGGYKCYPATYVCNKGYGDCKAMSNYMKALLKAVNIPAYWVLIYADDSENPYKIVPEFTSNQFNHVILCVPLKKDTVWLECTSKTNPCGYLGTFTQGRYALVINENKSRLIKTPALEQSNCLTISKRAMVIDTTNGVILNASGTYSGKEFDEYSSYAVMYNKVEQEKYLYSILPYENFEVKKWNIINNSKRDSAIIKMNYQLLLKNSFIKSGNYWSVEIGGLRIPQFESPAKRTLPVRISYPVNFIDSVTITLPNGYTAESLSSENIETAYGQIKIQYVVNKNTVQVYRTFLIKPCDVEINDYPSFFKFITKYKEEANVQISLRKYE